MAKNKQSIIAAPTSPLSNPCPSLVHIIHHQLTSCIIFLLTYLVVISVQFSRSVMSNSLQAPWIAAFQASLSITNSRNLPILMSTESVMPFNHLILCCPLLLLPSIFASIGVFSNELALCIRWPQYWSFSVSPSNEYSGLISFGMDWLDLLAVQGTQESSSTS